jgi:ABC-type Fe3+ transport system substrate-binding protein
MGGTKLIKQFLGYTAGLTTALFLAFSPASAQSFPDPSDQARLYELAKAEGKIMWYIAGPLEPFAARAKAFEKQFPGITVQIQRLTGPQLYQRFIEETEAGQYIADNLEITDRPGLVDLMKQGHIAKWRVPTHDRFPPAAILDEMAYSPVATVLTINYNINKVTEEEAKLLAASWQGILDPRFKGRFTISDSKTGTSYGPINMFLDPALKDQFGTDYLKKVVAQQPTLYNDNNVAMDRVIAGEQDIMFWGWEGLAISKWNIGAPIRWVYPNPTPSFPNQWMAISAHAPHPNAARLFQNWLNNDDGARNVEEVYGSRSVLSGFADTRAVAKAPWFQGPVKIYQIDMDRWESNYDAEVKTWHKIIQEGLIR